MSQKRRGRYPALTAAILACLWVIVAQAPTATAAQPVAATSAGPLYRDYLSPTQTTVQIAGVGADQCAKPVANRVGKWWCPTGAGGYANHARTGATPAATANGTQGCTPAGCYYRYDDFHLDFGSNVGNWGYGTKVLGREAHYIDWKLQGAQTTSKPVQYTNTTATTSVVFTGDLLNASPGVNGTEVPGKFSLYNAGNVPANTTTRWNPNGYKSYDNTNFDHTQVQQFSWNLPGYSGYWYAYVKSTCTPSFDKAIYRFDSVGQLPGNPYGGNYHP